MDIDGIDAEVLYPSIGMSLTRVPDVEYQLACVRAYNDWLVELCAGRRNGSRARAPVRPSTSAPRSTRCSAPTRSGCAARSCPAARPRVTTPRPASTRCGRSARSASLPVSFHIALTGDPAGDPMLGSGIRMMTVMSVVQPMQQTLALFMFGGVFERHPQLTLVSAEHDAGWVAHYAYRLDQMCERHHHWLGPDLELSRRPSEYLGTTCGSRSRRTRWRSRPAAGWA